MNTSTSNALLAIDPGTLKCGLAILDCEGNVLFREISSIETMERRLTSLMDQWHITRVVYGTSTGSKLMRQLLEKLQSQRKSTFTLHSMDETNSTLEARPLYWQEYPRRGLLRLVPLSLLTPPVAIDDFAAVVLGRRLLKDI